MKELLKQIDGTLIALNLTIEQARELKSVLEKDMLKKGIPTDKGCKCPHCGTELVKGGYHCPCCGQRAEYVESDTIPL